MHLRTSLLLLVAIVASGCSSLVPVKQPTDLHFVKDGTVMDEPIHIDYYNVEEDGIAEDLSDYLNDSLDDEGFTLVRKVRDASLEVKVKVHYFGLNQAAAEKKVIAADQAATAVIMPTLEAAVHTDAGVQAITNVAGTSAVAVPGIGVLVGSAIEGVSWLMEHGENDYFMGTTFVIKELPKTPDDKGRVYRLQSSGGGHFNGRGEAIDGLIEDARADLVQFLLQQQPKT